MFRIEVNGLNGWQRFDDSEFSSSEYAKAHLKRLYKDSVFPGPIQGAWRIVDSQGLVYFIFAGVTGGGRFVWKLAPRQSKV